MFFVLRSGDTDDLLLEIDLEKLIFVIYDYIHDGSQSWLFLVINPNQKLYRCYHYILWLTYNKNKM